MSEAGSVVTSAVRALVRSGIDAEAARTLLRDEAEAQGVPIEVVATWLVTLDDAARQASGTPDPEAPVRRSVRRSGPR